MGVSWQAIYKWRENSAYTPKSPLKRNVIEKAGDLFSLNQDEKEALANKAGLSICDFRVNTVRRPSEKSEAGDSQISYKNQMHSNKNFSNHFKLLLSECPGDNSKLCESASVSDRMFRHIKSGKHLRKEPILALLIIMGLELEDVQIALKKAGFFLSNSLYSDAVVIWMLKNKSQYFTSSKLLDRINDVLASLGFPLLMTEQRE